MDDKSTKRSLISTLRQEEVQRMVDEINNKSIIECGWAPATLIQDRDGTYGINIEGPHSDYLQRNKTTMDNSNAIFCEHANEVPGVCNCPEYCYCKQHTCKSKTMYLPKPPVAEVNLKQLLKSWGNYTAKNQTLLLYDNAHFKDSNLLKLCKLHQVRILPDLFTEIPTDDKEQKI